MRRILFSDELDRLLGCDVDDLRLGRSFVRTSLVAAELPGAGEALAARGALERALRLVQPPVVAQIPRVRELLPAVATRVVLVAGVRDAHVLLHIVQPCERLATVRAEDAALVHAPVVRILPAGVHLLAAQPAPVQHLPRMQPLVLRQVAADRKPLPADIALVRFFAGVGAPVLGHSVAADEFLAAHVAHVRLVARVRPVVVDVLAQPAERLAAVLEVAHVDHLLADGSRGTTAPLLRDQQRRLVFGGFGQLLSAVDDALQQHFLEESLLVLLDQRRFRLHGRGHTVQVGIRRKHRSIDLVRLIRGLFAIGIKSYGSQRQLLVRHHYLPSNIVNCIGHTLFWFAQCGLALQSG